MKLSIFKMTASLFKITSANDHFAAQINKRLEFKGYNNF